MKAIEIVEIIKKENPKLADKMDDKKMIRIINMSLKVMCQQISAVDEGLIKISGLGNFIVKQVANKKDSEKPMVKRVVFRPEQKKKRDTVSNQS